MSNNVYQGDLDNFPMLKHYEKTASINAAPKVSLSQQDTYRHPYTKLHDRKYVAPVQYETRHATSKNTLDFVNFQMLIADTHLLMLFMMVISHAIWKMLTKLLTDYMTLVGLLVVMCQGSSTS